MVRGVFKLLTKGGQKYEQKFFEDKHFQQIFNLLKDGIFIVIGMGIIVSNL